MALLFAAISDAHLLRGGSTTVAVPVHLESGTEVTPTAWAVGLWRGEVELQTASGVGAASWAITVPSTYELAADYQLRWSITTAIGTITTRQSALVCLSRLHPAITPADIYRRLPALDPTAAEPIMVWGSGESALTQAVAAWDHVLSELRTRGAVPRLIVSPQDLRLLHIAKTCELICEALAATLPEGTWLQMADRYRAEWDRLRAALSVEVAPPDQRDGDPERISRVPTLGGSWIQAGIIGDPWSYR